MFSTAGAEFVENYQRDTPVRWSAQDLAAQREFVNARLGAREWLDWSTPAAMLQLVQASHAQTSVGTAEKYDAVVLAGPAAELLEPAWLFGEAARPLRPGGRLIGIIPCLRDNSPESQTFAQLVTKSLWPCYTAEELLEMLREGGWEVASAASSFVAIPRFNEAVLESQMGFKGFNPLFARLISEGYDPMEVGWGELRFVATLNAKSIH